MEEGTGTELADGSGHGRGATLTGSIAWSEGKIGRGVTFDAGTHALTAAAVLRTDQSYTVSAWAKLSRGDVSSAVVSQDGAVNSAFKLAYSSGDKKWRLAAYAADATGSGESKAVSSQEAKIGVWTHLTGIYDAQARKLRLYEDGELVAESDYTSNWNATGGLLIGRTKFDGAYQHSFRGTLDEVRAYDKVLSADQVRTLTATTTPKV
ncbi:LamG domain-containing protein, partial [Planobispora longispora]